MTTQLTVSSEPAARARGAVDAVIASLPVSLAPAPDAALLTAVDGSTGWAGRTEAAHQAGALAAVVIAPTTPEALAETSVDKVLIDWPFASHPALEGAAAAAEGLRPSVSIVESRIVVPATGNLDLALVDQLTALNRLLGGTLAPGSLRRLHQDAHGYLICGQLGDSVPLSVSAVVTDALPPQLQIRILTTDGGLTAAIPSPDTAAPAEVRVTTAEGEQLLPTLYESAHRATWRRAHNVATDGLVTTDVDELRRTAALVR